MADERDVQRLVLGPRRTLERSFVDGDRAATVRRIISAAIVLVSVVIATTLLWQDATGDSSGPPLLVTSATPTPTPQARSAAVSTRDGFHELRHLPTGSTGILELWSIPRTPEGDPVLTVLRSDSGDLTGAVFIDRVSDRLGHGLGAVAPREVEIAGLPARLTATGPGLSHVIEVDAPGLGLMRAWGLGTTASEHQRVVSDLVNNLMSGEEPALGLPADWHQVRHAENRSPGPIWRAFYLASGGEIAVVQAAPSTTSSVECDDGDGVCDHLVVTVDEDLVEIVTFGSAPRVAELAESVRPTGRFNQRIVDFEFEPLAPVDVDDVDLSDLLYLPPADDQWQVTETFVHFSGERVDEPIVTLVERDVPVIGDPLSAVVVRLFPAGRSGVADVDHSEEVLFFRELVVDRPDAQLQLRSWRHSVDEVQAIAELITILDEGVAFASRALADVGVDRQYDTTTIEAFPQSAIEGVVFGALITSSTGNEYVLRSSKVPTYSAEAALVEPHDAAHLLSLRNHHAALIERNGLIEVSWEERPGTLLRLIGPDQHEILQIAMSLERLDIDDLLARGLEP